MLSQFWGSPHCDKDEDSCLIIQKSNKTYLSYKGQQCKDILHDIENGTYNQGKPVCFCAPKVNKCKILSDINLSEILPEIKKVVGERMLMLATSNAGYNPKKIYLEYLKASIPVIDILKKVNPKITAMKQEDLIKEPNTTKGSNPGGIYRDKLGKKFYIKFPHKRAWDGDLGGTAVRGDRQFGQEMGNNAVKNEVIAAKFYQLGGIRVPTLSLVKTNDKGCLGIASEMVNFKEYRHLSPEDQKQVLSGDIPGLYEGFAFDAWLGCWDVCGASGDNIGVVEYQDGRKEVMRIDVGGALEYRACGLLKGKDGSGFTQDNVAEVDTLKQYSRIFRNIPDEQIKTGVEKIAKISDEEIKKMIRDNGGPGDEAAQTRLANKLIQRKNFLMNKYGVSPDIIKFTKDFQSLASTAQKFIASTVAGPSLQPIDSNQFVDHLIKQKQQHFYEPEFKHISRKKQSAGVLIVEDDGRIWMYEPKNAFGGYSNTFPKGRLDGKPAKIAAVREAFEETGLQVEIIGYLGDFEKSTTNNRYYIAKRVGGAPFAWKGTDWQPIKSREIEETEAVILVDCNILKELEQRNSGSAKGMDLPIILKFLTLQEEAIKLGEGSFFNGLEIIQQKSNAQGKDVIADGLIAEPNAYVHEDWPGSVPEALAVTAKSLESAGVDAPDVHAAEAQHKQVKAKVEAVSIGFEAQAKHKELAQVIEQFNLFINTHIDRLQHLKQSKLTTAKIQALKTNLHSFNAANNQAKTNTRLKRMGKALNNIIDAMSMHRNHSENKIFNKLIRQIRKLFNLQPKSLVEMIKLGLVEKDSFTKKYMPSGTLLGSLGLGVNSSADESSKRRRKY